MDGISPDIPKTFPSRAISSGIPIIDHLPSISSDEKVMFELILNDLNPKLYA